MNEEFDPDVVAQYERDTWNRCADGYVDTFAGITRETVPLLLEAGAIQPGSKVLDIGSGPGHVADLLFKAGANVTGVDFSSNMVEVAQRDIHKLRLSRRTPSSCRSRQILSMLPLPIT